MDRSTFEYGTARLHMAALSLDDRALYCSLYTDPMTMRWIGPPLTPSEALRGFRTSVRAWEREQPRRAIVAFRDRASGQQAIGIGGYFNARVDTISGFISAETGAMLCRDARGKGLGSEAFRALVEHGFTTFAVHALTASCADSNHACKAALQQAGFIREARASHPDGDPREWIVLRGDNPWPSPGLPIGFATPRSPASFRGANTVPRA